MDDVRQVSNPTKRAAFQGVVGYFADDLRTNIFGTQDQLGCAGDVVGDTLSLRAHGGLEVEECVLIFEPLQGDIPGREVIRLAGEVHCLPRWDPAFWDGYHRCRRFG